METKNNVDANRKKSGRGRGSSGSSRGRGSKSNDQTRTQISSSTVSASNGQNENVCRKVTSHQIFGSLSNKFYGLIIYVTLLDCSLQNSYFCLQDGRLKDPFRNDNGASLEVCLLLYF